MKYLTSTKILLNVTFVWLFSLSSWKNCSCPTPTCHSNGPILPLSKRDHVFITLGSLISGLEGVPLSASPWTTLFPRGPPASGSVLGFSPSYNCSLCCPLPSPPRAVPSTHFCQLLLLGDTSCAGNHLVLSSLPWPSFAPVASVSINALNNFPGVSFPSAS